MLQESQQALKRTNALTLADLVALAGAEAVAAVGGPEISVQLGRTDSEKLGENMRAVAKGGEKAAGEWAPRCHNSIFQLSFERRERERERDWPWFALSPSLSLS